MPEDRSPHERSRGQSLVEMALIMPIIAFLLLGIYDLSRVFTSAMAVESAAREAADYGAWRSGNWADAAVAGTVAGMEARACLASRNLTDFAGSTIACTNPSISIDLLDQNGDSALDKQGPLKATSDCDKSERKDDSGGNLDPCRVKVDLTYTFDLIIPLEIEFFGTHLGLPSSITFTRTSIFAISDFTIDQ